MENIKFDYLYTELNDIIQNEKISTFFQPIVSLKNGEIFGYEALSRGPENSIFYNPIELFDYARKFDLLLELEHICRLNALKSAADKIRNKKLFMNIDPYIMQDKKFNKSFTKELLKKFNIKPNDIIFEITENTSIKELNCIRKTLDKYMSQGYDFALDDTGSGYSGLLMLAETQPKYIKIDMELIRDIDKNIFKRNLINTFCDFSRNNMAYIIAEGIETEKELKTLIELGVEYGQGYLIQEPQESIKDIDEKVVYTIKDMNKSVEKSKFIWDEKYSIGCIAREENPIDLSTTIEEVNDIFSTEYNLQGIPVVFEQKPVGLVMRNKFYYQIARRNIEIDSKSSIGLIMTKLPLIVDYHSSVKEVARMIKSRKEECLYDYIVVVKDNVYYGVVTVASLLESLSQ